MEINLTSVSIFAENLRNDLLSVKPPLIKGRRQFFRTYPNTFVGNEVVEWWMTHLKEKSKTDINKSENNNNDEESESDKQTSDVEVTPDDITQVMQTLADFGILHSIHGDAPFKNDSSLYRFTADDGSCCGVVEALVKGKRLHESTLCPNCALLQRVCEYGEFISDKCMRGSDLISWVIEHGLASHRDDAMRVCRLMHDHGIIKPASKHIREFTDGRPFYIFGVDFTAPSMSIETFVSLLNTTNIPDEIVEGCSTDNATAKPQHVRQLSGQLLDMSVSDQRSVGRRKNTSSSSIGSDDSGYNEHAAAQSQTSYTSLLTKDGKLTPEALAHQDAPFTKKYLRIYPDAVGYGFIIRGSGPCYVKIVDPESPAGKSGLKAWQYITEINNRDVTKKNHTEIEDLILTGPKCLLMTVMIPKQENGYAHLQHINTDVRKLSYPVETQSSKSSIPKEAGATNGVRRQSVPCPSRRNNLPSAQPWMKQQRKASDFDVLITQAYIH